MFPWTRADICGCEEPQLQPPARHCDQPSAAETTERQTTTAETARKEFRKIASFISLNFIKEANHFKHVLRYHQHAKKKFHLPNVTTLDTTG